MAIQALLHRASFRLFPGTCIVCGLPSGLARDLCSNCETSLPRLDSQCRVCADSLASPGICGACLNQPPAFSRVIAPLRFAPPVDRLIHRFKYRSDLAAGTVLTDILCRHLSAMLTTEALPDLLVPVPLHWTRLCWRGYNQAHEIASQLSSHLDLPCSGKLLRRRKRTSQSRGLDRNRRLANLKNAFQPGSQTVDGLRLALVDDVVTSTATIRTLASLLRNAGAREVQVWCLARTVLEK